MTTQNLYLLDTAASGSNHNNLQFGGSAPATSTSSSGWTVGTLTSPNYAAMAARFERGTGIFQTTPALPGVTGPNNNVGGGSNGDCFRTGVLDGVFDAGVWVFTFPVIAVTAGGAHDGRMRFRLWRSTSPTGAGALEIPAASEITPSGTVTADKVCSTVTNLTTAEQSSTLTVTLPQVGFVNEYFFIQVAWDVVGAGAGATDDVLIRNGSAAVITTPNWVPGGPTLYDVDLGGVGAKLEYHGSYRRSVQEQFAIQLSVGDQQPGKVLIRQTNWDLGEGWPNFDGKDDFKSRGYVGDRYGMDPITDGSGQIITGPALNTSNSTARNAARVFGLYNSQLYCGFSNGAVDRITTFPDTWANVGTIAGNPPVAGIGFAGSGYHAQTARMIIITGTDAKVSDWDGTTFTSNRVDAAVTGTSLMDRFTAVDLAGYGTHPFHDSGTDLIIGGKRQGLNSARVGTVSGSTWTASTWYADSVVLSDGYPDVTCILTDRLLSVPKTIQTRYARVTYVAIADTSAAIGQLLLLYEDPTDFSDKYYPLINFTGHYPLSLCIFAGKLWVGMSSGRLLAWDGTNLTDFGTIGNGQAIYGLAEWLGSIWAVDRTGTSALLKRIVKDPTDQNSGYYSKSTPVIGGTIDASATAMRQLYSFGGDLYLATENSGAAKVYRVRAGVFNTSPVTLTTSLYGVADGDSPESKKNWTVVTVMHAFFNSGDSISLDISLDRGAWQTIGTDSTVGSTVSNFTLPETAAGYVIELRLTTTSGASNRWVEIEDIFVTGFAAGTQAAQAVLRSWEFTLDEKDDGAATRTKLRDGTSSPITGSARSKLIWALLARGESFRYRDLDGSIYVVAPDGFDEDFAGWPQKNTAQADPTQRAYQFNGTIRLKQVS